MSTQYWIVNTTKREYLTFSQFGVKTRSEIINYPVATAVIACYLLLNAGDTIRAVSEDDLATPEYRDYVDVTDAIIDVMIAERTFIEKRDGILGEADAETHRRKIKFRYFDWQFRSR